MYPVDVTDQNGKKAEANRISRQELIGQIAIGVAHEIRNPLTVIKGYLQVLENKPSSRMQETLGIIFQEIDQIEALVSNFISVARNKAIEKKSKNLNHILEQFYPVIEEYAVRHSAVLELFLCDDLPMLDLNAEEIKQLVMNLVRNGIEAMPMDRRLTIGTLWEPGRVILYVSDEGIGIPPEQMEKIFDPFYTTKTGSTGLGLAIVFSIVERHHGQIEIVSNIKAGTTFKVIFPVKR